MPNLRANLEAALERYGRTIFRHRIKVTVAMVVLAGLLIFQVTGIRFDTSTESFFHATDPTMVDYNAFRDQFGRDEFLVIAIAPPNVFDRAFLEKLRAFHDALEKQVPHVKEVTSLINARLTRGEGDVLIVEDLVENIPATAEGMQALKERVLGSELYPNLLISEDGRFTTVLIETHAFSSGEAETDLSAGFGDGQETDAPGGKAAAPVPLSDEENSAVVKGVEAVIGEFQSPDFPLSFAGSPVVTDHLKRAMQKNMGRFIVLSLAAIGLFLLVLFRRITGVVLPLLVVMLSVGSSFGVLALTGVTFKLPLMILPSFMLAVGVGASVHLLAIFYRHFQRNGDKEAAIAYALGHSGLPIVMTALTTAAGLASFASAALAAVADLGIFASFGVLLSLIYTLVLLPALLALVPLRQTPRFAWGEGSGLADQVLLAVSSFATRKARWVLAASALIVVLAAAGLPALKFSHNTLVWFPLSDPLRQSSELIDRELKGSLTVEMIVDTGRDNGIKEPEVLKAMESLGRYAEAYRNEDGDLFVGKTNSVVQVVKEIHRALNENRPEFYRLPEDQRLISQELLLFENSGSDDLERLVDTRFSKAHLTIKAPWDDAAAYVNFLEDLDREGDRIFGDQADVHTTGLLKLFTRSINALMNSMATSYSIAFVVITVLMILLIGRFRLGLLSMIPNLAPILVALGFMGWFGIRLDAFTLLVGSISLGLAVDDTIHFFHNYLRYYSQSREPSAAVRETLITTGRAMLFTTLVLVTGFWLYMFATLNNLFFFGLLTGLTLIVALLADILLAPAMMMVAHRLAIRKPRR